MGSFSEKDDATIRNLRSSFGKQVRSPHQSEPVWGFGTSHRDATSKLFLSQELTKVLAGNNSQGPIYRTYEAFGSQMESKYLTLPMPGFGTAPRLSKSARFDVPGPGAYHHDSGIGNQKESRRPTSQRTVFGAATRESQSKVWLDEEAMKNYHGRDTPGPNSYTAYAGVGKQIDSKYSTLPSWKQSTETRFKRFSNCETPGAGHYSVYQSIGKQPLSTKITLPTPKIGTGTRDAVSKKTFISKDHERVLFGLITPGPTTAKRVDSVGPQTMSLKPTSPKWGFTIGKRSLSSSLDTPGPGAYWA